VGQVLATLNLVYLASHGGADTNSRGQYLAHIAVVCSVVCSLCCVCVAAVSCRVRYYAELSLLLPYDAATGLAAMLKLLLPAGHNGEQVPIVLICRLTLQLIRVRVEMVGSKKHRILGRSQSVLIVIKPIIFTRNRMCACMLDWLCAGGGARWVQIIETKGPATALRS
jgi:hypothetical protein